MTSSNLPQKSKALVVEEKGGPFKLVEIDLNSDSLDDDDVLVEFHASGICHTDLGSWSGKIPSKYPCILGHEGSGEVLKVGKNLSNKFKKGDFVVASFLSCGDCQACKRQDTACCDLFLAINLAWFNKNFKKTQVDYQSSEKGATETEEKKKAYVKYFGQSSFGNIMSVTGRSLTLVSKDVPPKFTCALACGFQTGFSSVMEKANGKLGFNHRNFDRYSMIDPSFSENASANGDPQHQEFFQDETLLVMGLGAVGIGALVAGKLLKFGKIIACDINEKRLELIKNQLEIQDCLNSKDYSTTEDFVKIVKEKSISGRGSTLFIEATGNINALKNGILSMAIRGKAILLGALPPTVTLDIPTGKILENIWTIEGVLMGNSNPSITIPFLINLIKKGQLNIIELIVKTYKPDQINQAIHDAETGDTIKPVIEWI